MQRKKPWNGLLRAVMEQLSAEYLEKCRPDWRERDAAAHLRKVEKLFGLGLTLGLTQDLQSLDRFSLDLDSAGILIEGAAMGLAMVDLTLPAATSRWAEVARTVGSPHIYAVYAGKGMAFAKLGKKLPRHFHDHDPLLIWLVIDGFAFHHAYSDSQKYIHQRFKPKLRHDLPYVSNAFDQGIGRSMWFVFNGDADQIAKSISKFDKSRQADLWSGIGLACAHAGLVAERELLKLRDAAGSHVTSLALGAVLAAKIRSHANTLAEHTHAACKVFAGMTALEAIGIADQAHAAIRGANQSSSPYQAWRENICNIIAEPLAV